MKAYPKPAEIGQRPKPRMNARKSPRIKPNDIRMAHQKSTEARIKAKGMVLAIQDTTDLNFTKHPSKQGIGPISTQATVVGLKVHSVLGVSTLGVPLGMLHQQVWARNSEELGKRHRRRQRHTEDKESQRWLSALDATESAISDVSDQIEIVTIADREADIYDLFARVRRLRCALSRPASLTHLLIRGTHNRRVNHEAEYLHAAIHQEPIVGELTIEVPRGDERPSRQATLTLRFTTLEIQPPHHHLKRATLAPLTIQVVLVEEQNPPDEITPISWLLLTTLPVNGFDDAVECVRWYTYRWLIERYHYVLMHWLSPGTTTTTNSRTHRASREQLTLLSPGAYCGSLMRLANNQTHLVIRFCRPTSGRHSLCTIHSQPIPPDQPPSLRQAVRWIAQLGGFLGRRHDGEPGVKTIWRGWQRLQDIAATWQLLHSHHEIQPQL